MEGLRGLGDVAGADGMGGGVSWGDFCGYGGGNFLGFFGMGVDLGLFLS